MSFMKHAMHPEWPLRNCPILAEFIEYLKGETHFLAMVCQLSNPVSAEKRQGYIDQMTAAGTATPEIIAAMEEAGGRMGLLEMGVVKEMRPKSQLLAPDNIDVAKLQDMARIIATDCGLPTSTKFFHTNPVQLFDFSALAKCQIAAKILRGDGTLLDGTVENAQDGAGVSNTALVFPVGDALQEPLWTSGLGVNRGFHGGLNAVWAAAIARKQNLRCAMSELSISWQKMQEMHWGDGRLVGGGSGSSGVKAGCAWTADPCSRLPMKR